MKATYRQYKKLKIKIKPYKSNNIVLYRYTVKGTKINDIAMSETDAVCCAIEEIEDYLRFIKS